MAIAVILTNSMVAYLVVGLAATLDILDIGGQAADNLVKLRSSLKMAVSLSIQPLSSVTRRFLRCKVEHTHIHIRPELQLCVCVDFETIL